MANSDLAALVTAESEALEVEYKSWTDTSVMETSAKLARHLAALSKVRLASSVDAARIVAIRLVDLCLGACTLLLIPL
jgi:hypothetical protein